jgi:gamma-glutamyl-gamma-aminobutyrate hydrolase PuuD
MITVSQRVVPCEQRNETSDSLDHALVDLLLAVGLLPVPIPNAIHKAGRLSEWLQNVNPRGIVLSGGNDLGLYPERDATETGLITYAHQRGIPLLGICRGMQMLATWAGTSLKPVANHVRQRHTLSGEIQGEVNSFHNYSIANCPADFTVLARSDDGEIEAIRHVRSPFEGWMWHPEREDRARTSDLARLRSLFCG